MKYRSNGVADQGVYETADKVVVQVHLSSGATLPAYASEGAAGLDLRCVEPVELNPLERKLVHTGVRVAIPSGFEGQVRPRSGLALRLGLGMANSVGTIDSDYRGEIGVILINLSDSFVSLDSGERVAQLVICPVAHADLVQVEEFAIDTHRGEGGFGSTGTR